MDLRSAATNRDDLLARRLDEIVPQLMERHDFEAWVIDAREYNEDPVARTMLPATWLGTARRRTILVFRDYGRDRGAISRYPVGTFPSVWNPDARPDQWAALADSLADVKGTIGVNISQDFGLADGLSSTEHLALVLALSEHHVESAESLALGWLETRLDTEFPLMTRACRIAHGILRRALSAEVIVPGETTTEDVAWWLTQTAHDAGYQVWFHPGVSVQRKGDDIQSPADARLDRTIVHGDLVHIDFGIVRHGYHTDQQQHAYVSEVGQSQPPRSLVEGLSQANRLQEILMGEMIPGRTGNETLAAALEIARSEGIRPVVYTHPLGLHGHAAGATIGLWDNQEKIEGAGDYPIGINTAWSIELAAEIDVAEWGGQPVRIMLEEDAYLTEQGVSFLDGRQTELWMIS